MGNNIKRLVLKITVIVILIRNIVLIPVLTVLADIEDDDPMIVVSLGDSYSSGEGIEPFYDQQAAKHFTAEKEDEDWLAHRSAKSWPSKLVVPGYEGVSGSNTMNDYRYNLEDSYGYSLKSLQNNCIWYFVAASGATTDNINNEEQEKTVRSKELEKSTKKLPKQMDVFQKIEGEVDYVTITIGGNDVEFAGIMKNAALHSNTLNAPEVSIQLNELWNNIEFYKAKIRKVYYDIATAAPEADIIVAGYPQLLDPPAVGTPYSPEEVKLINDSVSAFNDVIEELVIECSNKGMKIHFVDVEPEFLTHGAYSKEPWINPIMLGPGQEELDEKAIVSSYSIHPNEEGAKAYAKCVNEMISKLEGEKKAKDTDNNQQTKGETESTEDWKKNIGKSSIDGKVVDSETGKPLKGVKIECSNSSDLGDINIVSVVTDDDGRFKIESLLKGKVSLILSYEDYEMSFVTKEIASNSEEYDVGTIKMSKKGHEKLPFREEYEGIPDLAVSSDDGYYVPGKENRTIVYYSKDRSTSKELDILGKSKGESVSLMQFYDGKLYVNGGNFYIYDPKSDTVKIAGFPSENYSISHNEWMVYGEKIYYIDRTSSGSYMLKAADLDGDPLEESIDIKHSDKLPFTWAPVNFIIYDDSVYYVNNMPEGSQILKAPLDGREQEVIYTGKAGYTVDVCDIKDDYLAVLIYNHELGSDVIVLPLKQELGHPIQVVESADISNDKCIKLYNGMVLYTVFSDGLYKYNLQSGETQKVTDQFSVSFSIIDDYIYAMLPEVKYLWYSLKE